MPVQEFGIYEINLRRKIANSDNHLIMKIVKWPCTSTEYGLPNPENCSSDAHDHVCQGDLF